MLNVFLVTILLHANGAVSEGSAKNMGWLTSDYAECEALVRQLSFTARPPEDALGIAFYCDMRPAPQEAPNE